MDLTKFTEKFRGFFSRDVAIRVIVLVGLLGMALILISQLTSTKDRTLKTQPEPDPQTAQFTIEQYTADMENKLQKLITTIEGVGEAQVMVTLEHGIEYVYAQEEKTSLDKSLEPGLGEQAAKEVMRQDVQSSYVLVDTEYGKKQALVKTQLQPKVQGVVIVCQGADSIQVQNDLIHVVTTALHIPTPRVCVVPIDQQTT